jgi:hypothetical protein
MAGKLTFSLANAAVGLLVLAAIFNIMPVEIQPVSPVSAASTWSQSNLTDFQAGVFDNVTSNDQKDVLELKMLSKTVRDNFDDSSGIWYQKNVIVDNAEGEAKLVNVNRTFGGIGRDIGTSIQPTSDGGFIILGFTESYGAGKKDMWLIKTDASGIKQWERTFGGGEDDEGSSIQETSDEGFIIVGTTGSTGHGSTDIWLIKTNSLGEKQWDKVFGGSKSEEGRSVRETFDGGFVIVGSTESFGPGSSSFWLIKTDSDGNNLWNTTFGGPEFDRAGDVRQTSDGGFILTGYTWSFGSGESDLWLIKTNSSGGKEWNKTYGGADNDYGTSLVVSLDGYVITGYTWSYSPGNSNIWLLKTNFNGGKLWDWTYGGANSDYGYAVSSTSDGGYIIIGETSTATNSDVYMIKTGTLGNQEWAETFDASEHEKGIDVLQTADGGYMIAGFTDPHNVGDLELWLIKTDDKGNVNIDSGELRSVDIIHEPDIYSVISFHYEAVLSKGTSIMVQFSQDNISWYNSFGQIFAWNTLQDGVNTIFLTDLTWTKPNFYYRLSFSSNLLYSPVIKEVSLDFFQFATSGTYTSPIFDSKDDNSTWKFLSWTANIRQGTSLQFQLRSSDSINKLLISDTAGFKGPDGKASTYYQHSHDFPIWEGHSGNRFVQYRAYFLSSGKNTCDLSAVDIIYNSIPSTSIPERTAENVFTNDNSPTLEWEFNDPDGAQNVYQVLIDNETTFTDINYDSGKISSSETSWTYSNGTEFSILDDGMWFWKVRASDSDGDWSSYSNYSYFIIDTEPPESMMLSMPAYWISAYEIDINFSAVDTLSGIDYFFIRIDDGDFNVQESPYRLPPLISGIHKITMRAYDKAGNYHEMTEKLHIDTYPPSIQHEPIEHAFRNDDITLKARVEDGYSGVDNVTLFYRHPGEKEYKSIIMSRSGEIFTATIPAEDTSRDIEYYIEALDNTDTGNNNYYTDTGETRINPNSTLGLIITITEPKSDESSFFANSNYTVSILIAVFALIVFGLWIRFASRKGLMSPIDEEEEEIKEKEYTVSKPATPHQIRPEPRDGPRPATIKRPHQKSKKRYFEQPPEMKSNVTKLLDDKTAMIKFKCSFCGKKSIVQVSKDFHSVICPNCDEETSIGQDD